MSVESLIKKPLILIVEDEAAIKEMLQLSLNLAGFATAAASSTYAKAQQQKSHPTIEQHPYTIQKWIYHCHEHMPGLTERFLPHRQSPLTFKAAPAWALL